MVQWVKTQSELSHIPNLLIKDFVDTNLLRFPERDTKQNNNNSADALKTICPGVQLPETLGNGSVSFSAHNSTN